MATVQRAFNRKGKSMRYAVLALATAAMMAGPAFAQQGEKEWANKIFGTHPHYDETRKDFGTCPRGAQLKHSFKITNLYKVPLEITDVQVGCGCVSYALSTKTLQPNETGYLHVNMDATRFSGYKQVNIYVRVGPKYISTATLVVQANARQDVTFNPGSLNFGVVARGQTPLHEIDVEYAGSFEWRINEIVKNATAPFGVTAQELYRLPPTPGRGGIFPKGPSPGRIGYRIAVTLKADAPAGYFKEELILKTNDPTSPLFAVAIDGNIQASLSVAPQIVNLGSVRVGDGKTQRVFVRGVRPFKITGIEGAGDGVRVEHSDQARESHIVTIHYQPTKSGDVRRQLRIRTNLDSETATVTVEANVPPMTEITIDLSK
jgi:uncharacterized protein DUF1573